MEYSQPAMLDASMLDFSQDSGSQLFLIQVPLVGNRLKLALYGNAELLLCFRFKLLQVRAMEPVLVVENFRCRTPERLYGAVVS